MNPTLVRRDMRYWRLQPEVRLRPWVLCYFMVEPASAAPADDPLRVEELLIPDGHAEIVFNLGTSFERWRVGHGDARELMRRSYLIGGRSQSVLTRNIDPVRLVGVKLDPRLLRGLIRAPLSEFSDGTLSLRDLNRPALLDLEDAVAGAGSAATVQVLLDAFFERALARATSHDRLIDRLLHDIRAQRGSLSIMDWSREHCVDPRRLERRFGDAVGVTPKRYARVIRFKHSYHQLIAARSSPAAVHLDGYYDQSHFNKEFKHFIGVAPSVRLRGRMPQGTTVCDHLLQGELTQQ